MHAFTIATRYFKLHPEWTITHTLKARALLLSNRMYLNLSVCRRNEREALSGVRLIRGRSHVIGVQRRILGHEDSRTDYELSDYAASCLHPPTAQHLLCQWCGVDVVSLQVRLLGAI